MPEGQQHSRTERTGPFMDGELGNQCMTTHSCRHSGTNTECHEGAEEEEVTEDLNDLSQGDGPSTGL